MKELLQQFSKLSAQDKRKFVSSALADKDIDFEFVWIAYIADHIKETKEYMEDIGFSFEKILGNPE